MVVFFDIGSTLIEGPPYGPPRRIATLLKLPEDTLPELNRLLFQTAFDAPEPLAQTIARLFDRPLAPTLEIVRGVWESQLREAWIVPGARDCLARLKAAGFSRAYITNIWPPFYQFFQNAFSEEALEEPQFVSFRCGLAKPDPDFYRLALNTLRVSPEDSVMVGDTYRNDIAPAKALGMRTVWLLHRPKKEAGDLRRVEEDPDLAPDLMLPSIAELTPELLYPLFPRKAA